MMKLNPLTGKFDMMPVVPVVGTTEGTVAAGNDPRLGTISVTLPDGTSALSVGIRAPRSVMRDGIFDVGGSEIGELISDLISAAPYKVADVWIGDLISTASATVTVFPSAMAGGTDLAHAGTADQFPTVSDPITGRRGFGDPVGSLDRALVKSSGVGKGYFVVYRPYNIPATAAVYVLVVENGIYPIACGATEQEWVESVGTGSAVHYRDGYRGSGFGNGMQVIYVEVADNTTAGIKLGGINGLSLSMTGEVYALVELNDTLSSEEQLEMTAALMRYYGIRRKLSLIIDGNSIARGYGGNGTDWWSPLRMPSIFRNNIAVAGRTWTDVLAAREDSFGTLNLLGFRNVVVFVFEDVNSYNPASGQPGWNQSAAQVLASKWEYCAQVRALGHKVIISTCTPSIAITGAQEVQRLIGNEATRTSWQDHADALIDWANISGFDSLSSPLFLDGVHLTVLGYRYFADIVRRTVLTF